MKTEKTYYQLIVDQSGSMTSCVDNTINGFNEQVLKIREIEETYPNQEITMGLTLFSSKPEIISMDVRPADMVLLSHQTYRPAGFTALLDAIGITVQQLENEWLRSRDVMPATAVVVIITDGHENSSSIFQLESIRSMISRLEDTGKWTFSFLGATLDAIHIAHRMNIKEQNSMRFDKEDMTNQVWGRLSKSSGDYFHKKSQKDDLSKFL